MARTIITHVGTTVLTKEKLQKDAPAIADLHREISNASAFADSEAARARIEELVETAKPEFIDVMRKVWQNANEVYRREHSPGEIASLSLLIQYQKRRLIDDRVVLLHTDTLAGAACATLLCAALTAPDMGAYFPSCNPAETEPIRVPGLKVTGDETSGSKPPGDPDEAAITFVREGMVNYVDKVWCEYTERRKTRANSEIVLNVTGGYKGLVPIARDVALILDNDPRNDKPRVSFTLVYLHEQNDRLIEYGSLPVSFLLDDYYDNLRAVAEGRPPLMSSIPPRNRVFYEERDQTVELSSLGIVAWNLCCRLRPH